ncbi:MAG: hypothetical protein KC731_16885, partial [Myxococcales bacterium]|nr:hypothetical protein [Myxococcales bacterium]
MKATRFTQAVAVCVLLGGCTAREPEPEELFPPEPPGRFEEFSPTEGPRALLVNEPSVLAELTFEKVLEQLATSAGAEVDAIGVYQRWWDGLNPASEAATSEAVHCDETTPPETLNGFPITCPKLEGELAHILPIEGYSPVAAVNRFDLAPPDGANCGEARVVFSLESALLFVHMVIFEALLPNPEPELGLAGCRPWVNVWLGLEDASTPDAAQRLAALYLTGID